MQRWSDALRARRAARRREARAPAQRRAPARGSGVARKRTASHRAPGLRSTTDWARGPAYLDTAHEHPPAPVGPLRHHQPDVSILALSRSSDAQWAAMLRIAGAAAVLLRLSAPRGDIAFRVRLADGSERDRRKSRPDGHDPPRGARRGRGVAARHPRWAGAVRPASTASSPRRSRATAKARARRR